MSSFFKLENKIIMAYQFDSNNPFNIRGVKISPQLEGSNPPSPKHNVNYYCIYIDVVKDSMAGTFNLANPTETGSSLTYVYTPTDPSKPSLAVPNAGSTTQTLMFPLYTNQLTDQPNSEQNNLFAVLSANGTSYKGNPNQKQPPVFDQVYQSAAYTCFPLLVSSITDSGVQTLVVLANTGSVSALNTGSITSESDGNDPVTYSLRFFFDAPTDSKPGKGHPVVCISSVSVGTNLNQFSQLYVMNSNYVIIGTTYTLGPDGWGNVPVASI